MRFTTPSESSPPASVVRTTLLDAAAFGPIRRTLSGPPNTGVYHWLQVPLGLDAAIALGSHLSLVPEFRFYFDPMAPLNDGCCDGGHARVRLAARWRF